MSSVTRTLYGIPAGTTTLMSILVAAELGIDLKVETVDFNTRQHKSPDYIANVHPLGKVPAYTEKNEKGETIFKLIESRAIARYLNSIGGNGLTPFHTPQEWGTFEQFAAFESTSFTPVLAKILVERVYAPMFGRATNEENAVKAVEEIRPMLQYLDDHLKSTNEYFLGSRFTLADILFFVFIHWIYVKTPERKVFEEYKAVDAWHTRVAERPHIQKALAPLL